MKSMKRINRSSYRLDEKDLAYEEASEENGFIELPVGTPVATFNFNTDDPFKPKPQQNLALEKNEAKSSPLIDNRIGKQSFNGLTPPIDGETFKYKRCYQFRESTVRMLNELKAAHPDVNVYLNTILDEAIRHYYKYFFIKIRTHSENFISPAYLILEDKRKEG
jgi:hypothetical protein